MGKRHERIKRGLKLVKFIKRVSRWVVVGEKAGADSRTSLGTGSCHVYFFLFFLAKNILK